jgi:type I restriction enzyme, S subunit
MDDVGKLVTPVPPLAEQRAIAAYLSRASAPLVEAVERTRQAIHWCGEYRTRLIADVVTGKLDVREAAARLSQETPEDEPLDEMDDVSQDESTAEDAEEEAEEAA